MKPRTLPLMMALLAIPTVSGCVAAVIPVAAAGAIGKKQIDKRNDKAASVEIPKEASSMPSGQAVEPANSNAVPAAVADDDMGSEAIIPVAGAEPSRPMPSGNFGAYASFVTFASGSAHERSGTLKEKSVVLMPSKSLEAPNFTVCETLPSAVLVDLDFNGGLERDAATGSTPAGAREALNALRDSGVKVIFMASVPEANAMALSEALDEGGFGPAIHGDTLWLVGDRGSYNKDSLRWKIASHNCIIAQAGDAPGDFSMLMGDRERVDASDVPALVAALGNAGWFVVPSLLTAMPSTKAQ